MEEDTKATTSVLESAKSYTGILALLAVAASSVYFQLKISKLEKNYQELLGRVEETLKKFDGRLDNQTKNLNNATRDLNNTIDKKLAANAMMFNTSKGVEKKERLEIPAYKRHIASVDSSKSISIPDEDLQDEINEMK